MLRFHDPKNVFILFIYLKNYLKERNRLQPKKFVIRIRKKSNPERK